MLSNSVDLYRSNGLSTRSKIASVRKLGTEVSSRMFVAMGGGWTKSGGYRCNGWSVENAHVNTFIRRGPLTSSDWGRCHPSLPKNPIPYHDLLLSQIFVAVL